MALPVLDGNQTATTLSSVVTGGEHIVAHSVVSLGANAIANITSAVSGSVVSISNFPSTQTVAGTVTANLVGWSGDNFENLRIGGFSVGSGDASRLALEVIGVDGNPLPISGTVTANLNSEFENSGVIYSRSNIFIGDPSLAEPTAVNSANPLPISGTVTVGNSVTIGSLPAISGTVTANVEPQRYDSFMGEPILPVGWATADGDVVVGFNLVTQDKPLPISGTVTANAILQNANAMAQAFIDESDGYGAVGVSIVNAAQSLSVFGAVTAAAPNGSLTTRFGTPTTANTAFATSAVTNANRKYLLIQNVTTGSNVITVGIGFTPTTTQGIQLTAGAGITFESSYIPTGQIFVLSSVTASNFTILEA